VPWTSFARIQRYDGNSGVRALSCAEQFRAMAFAQLTWRESLRDIEASLSANASKLYAMGFRSAVKRSTLADVNELRNWRIWSDLAAVLIRRAHKLYAGDSLDVHLYNTVYALDSSAVDLCLSLFEWAPFRPTKAAIKLHTLLDMLAFEPGAFYVMGRGYVDFARLYTMHQAGAFFVTRAFMANNTTLPTLTIAALYKSRWQVELFFKWIKQHLRIKKFLLNSENGVKTQVWCAVATYVLIATVKKELQLDASLYTCLQILSVSVFEKTKISCALQADDTAINLPTSDNQLNLFNI